MNDNASNEPAREAAYVGREMGFYYRELAAGAKPDWKRATAMMSRLLMAEVNTANDILALVVCVRTMLGNCLTDELCDDDPKLWTQLFAMHSLLDKAAKQLEFPPIVSAGDFDGTTPTAH